jgi:hypothetical protein
MKGLIVDFEGSVEMSWPLTEFSKQVDDHLTKIGLVKTFFNAVDEDSFELSCRYDSDEPKKGPIRKPRIKYNREFKWHEVKNFQNHPEQDIIVANGQSYIPISVLTERIRDPRFGFESLEYGTPDDQFEFYRCRNHFKLRNSLHPDCPEDMKRELADVIEVPVWKIDHPYEKQDIHDRKYSVDEVLEKVVRLWQNIDISKYVSE